LEIRILYKTTMVIPAPTISKCENRANFLKMQESCQLLQYARIVPTFAIRKNRAAFDYKQFLSQLIRVYTSLGVKVSICRVRS